MYSHYPW